MPSLQWIGKDKVVHHHLHVPFHILEHSYGFVDGVESTAKANSGNKIIHGDNLVALKSLLPEYEGKVNCIYIDPPYNTGNEGWVYNDNVNDPKIKKWLGEVVGKESEDLTRHDKWLCMMYPRLKLLHKLLADDGVIFISIDENEFSHIKLLLDEIFGSRNFVTDFIWQKRSGGGYTNALINKNHEYIFVYGKDINSVIFKDKQKDSETLKKIYTYSDKKGLYKRRDLRKSGTGDLREDRPTMFYDVFSPDNTLITPLRPDGRDGRWSIGQEKYKELLNSDEIEFVFLNNQWKAYIKERPFKEDGELKLEKYTTILTEIALNTQGSNEIKSIFPQNDKVFVFPKPTKLIQFFLELIENPNSIILDSFAGSGTTAHAVLNLNKKDGGNRKFILVEMEDYANSITAERVKRVINGYADVEGTGGVFDFFTIGDALFTDDGLINESVGVTALREYIYFSETQEQCNPNGNSNPYFLGMANDCSYYFFYIPVQVTTLNAEFLSTITLKSSQYVIYADTCALDEVTLLKNAIIFKKIPRDITRI